jgi:carboxypeptidase Q
MRYGDASRRIPAAAVTTEDAQRIARLVRRGRKVVVRLRMEARNEGEVPSANVVAELRGRELPEEVVVIGGHIDSWDVGQGAHDDGTGCVIAMEALSTLRRLGLRPRRTIRVVLWTNEENGLAGATRYRDDHADEIERHVAAIESDSGGFSPLGFSVELEDKVREERAAAQLAEILRSLEPIGATEAQRGFSGADVGPLVREGVPGLGLRVDGSHYFDIHHTAADTVDKVDPDELSRCVVSMATVAYALAEMPGRLGDPE